MFEFLLFKFKRTLNDDENDNAFQIEEDENHSRAAMSYRLQSKHCREILNLFVQSSMLHQHETLRRRLYIIYKKEYNMENIVEFE